MEPREQLRRGLLIVIRLCREVPTEVAHVVDSIFHVFTGMQQSWGLSLPAR